MQIKSGKQLNEYLQLHHNRQFLSGYKLKYQPLTFGKDTLYANSLKESDQGDIPDENFLSQLSDINGDGITDLFFTWTNDKGCYTKTYIFNNSSQLGLFSEATGKKLIEKYPNNIELGGAIRAYYWEHYK